MRTLPAAVLALALSSGLVACSNDQTVKIRVVDAGYQGCHTDKDCPQGPPPQHCLNGHCQPYCVRDDQCPGGQCCDFISGSCQASACRPDAGDTCVDGDRRCKPGTLDTTQLCVSSQWEDHPCPNAGEVCFLGYCVTCRPGDTRCKDASTLETCNTDGTAWVPTTCPSAAQCVAGPPALCKACDPGARRCKDPTTVQLCKSDGTAWEDVPCDPGEYCESVDPGKGYCHLCHPGDKRCASPTVSEQCDSSGHDWIPTNCVPGMCNAGTHECVACGPGLTCDCTPGTSVCLDDTHSQTCDSSGHLGGSTQCPSGQYCQNGSCKDLCQDAVNAKSFTGCEYWASVLSNTQLDASFKNMTAGFAVAVANVQQNLSATVTVTKAGGGVVATQTIAGGQLKVINLPWVSAADSGTGKFAGAYKISSTLPVSAYQFNPLKSSTGGLNYSYTNDASMLLPAHVLDKEYVVMAEYNMKLGTYPNMPGTFQVVASSPGTTTVNITYAADITGGGGIAQENRGGKQTYSLNQFDVLQIWSRDSSGSPDRVCHTSHDNGGSPIPACRSADLTGTVITASNPIAVFGGHDCVFNPVEKWACDHIEEQIFPFSTWGHHYVGAHSETVPGSTVNAPDVWRVLAGADATVVTISPAAALVAPGGFDPPKCFPSQTSCCNAGSCTLNANEFIEFATTSDFELQSQDASHPILLGQYFVSEEVTFPNPIGTGAGDPSLVLAAPVEQFRSNDIFLIIDTYAHNYINVVAPTGTAVSIDNKSWSNNGCPAFAPITNSTYSAARCAMTPGVHTLNANAPVGLTIYGVDSYVSYGYTGGLDLRGITIIHPKG